MSAEPAPGRRAGRGPEAGVTLIEMLVALALFSMIGLAGFTMLRTILDAQERTEGRMEQLARIDGTLRLLASDVETALPGRVTWDGRTLSTAGTEGATLWRAGEDGSLLRAPSSGPERTEPDTDVAAQRVLDGLEGWSWRFLPPDAGAEAWLSSWPPEGQAPDTGADAAAPAPLAAEVTLRVALGAGSPVEVRRLLQPPQGAGR